MDSVDNPYDALSAYTEIIREIVAGNLSLAVEVVAVLHIVSAIRCRDLDPYIALAVFLDPESMR